MCTLLVTTPQLTLERHNTLRAMKVTGLFYVKCRWHETASPKYRPLYRTAIIPMHPFLRCAPLAKTSPAIPFILMRF